MDFVLEYLLVFFLFPDLLRGELETDPGVSPAKRQDIVNSTLNSLAGAEKLVEAQQRKDDFSDIIPAKKASDKLAAVKVSLNFSGVSLEEVLNTLAKITDLNIVGGEGLTQQVTIYLKDISIA